MNQKELDAFKKGSINVQISGNIYECVGEQQPLGLVLSDVNDGYSINRTEEELRDVPSEDLVLPNGAQYLGLVHNADFENKELLKNSEYAVALLQVKPDIPERRDISFSNYEQACKYLGDGKKPEYDMYSVMHVEPMAKERLDEIGKINSSSFYTNLGDYMYEKLNNPETRPSVIDGYYGTSASVSNVVLVKEKENITALYIEGGGFKILEDFVPEKETESKDKSLKVSKKIAEATRE